MPVPSRRPPLPFWLTLSRWGRRCVYFWFNATFKHCVRSYFHCIVRFSIDFNWNSLAAAAVQMRVCQLCLFCCCCRTNGLLFEWNGIKCARSENFCNERTINSTKARTTKRCVLVLFCFCYFGGRVFINQTNAECINGLQATEINSNFCSLFEKYLKYCGRKLRKPNKYLKENRSKKTEGIETKGRNMLMGYGNWILSVNLSYIDFQLLISVLSSFFAQFCSFPLLWDRINIKSVRLRIVSIAFQQMHCWHICFSIRFRFYRTIGFAILFDCE